VVALIAIFVISVKLVMPIVVAVVLILLTLIVMFGNIKIRTRPVLITAFALANFSYYLFSSNILENILLKLFL